MFSNKLKLNADKTQVTVFGTRQQLSKFHVSHIRAGCSNISIDKTAVDLGIKLDSELKMTSHVANITSSCYYQLRQLRSVRRSLTTDVCKLLVRSLIISRIDYCNSVLYGATSATLARLQSVLNASAKFIARRAKYDHITCYIRDDLHWLPITQRIEYKLCLQAYKCLHGLAPSYLTVYFKLLSSGSARQGLRSATQGMLSVPPTKSKNGGRSFAVAGPSLYNGLSHELRDSRLCLDKFKSELKTFLFKRAYF